MVYLSDFCRCFRVKRKNKIKIYIGHVAFLINEVHDVIKRNIRFELLTTIWCKIIFRTPKRMNCTFCRILWWDFGFVVVVHLFLHREKSFISRKVEHWNLIVGKFQWAFSPVVSYVGSWKNEFLLLRKNFKARFLRVAIYCFFKWF